MFSITLLKYCDFCFLSPWMLGITLLGYPSEEWTEPTVTSFKLLAFVAVRKSRLSMYAFIDR